MTLAFIGILGVLLIVDATRRMASRRKDEEAFYEESFQRHKYNGDFQ